MRILYIDHYDSFTYNLIDWLQAPDIPFEIEWLNWDMEHAVQRAIGMKCPIVFSPGPNAPADVPPSLELVEYALGRVPILGICLGHQLLGAAAGFKVVRSQEPRHGAVRTVQFSNLSLFAGGQGRTIESATYNSLCLQGQAHQFAAWRTTATDDTGEIQAIENWAVPHAPAVGLQFHPESFLTRDSRWARDKWVDIVSKYYDWARNGGNSAIS